MVWNQINHQPEPEASATTICGDSGIVPTRPWWSLPHVSTPRTARWKHWSNSRGTSIP